MNTFANVLKYSPFGSIRKKARSYLESEGRRKEFWKSDTVDQQRASFYKQFVESGDLVFDVGANMGNRSKIFCNIGANVVAFEPQPICYEFLEEMFQGKKTFSLVKAALGSEPTTARMFLCDSHTISTLSKKWISSVKESGRFSEFDWDKEIDVEVKTLDLMIEEFGVPKFCKIDVEGFEIEVLRGLSTPVKYVSAEFASEFLNELVECVEHLCSIGDYEFQFSEGESMKFTFENWIDKEQIISFLNQFPKESFGDLYGRCKS